MQNKNIAQVAHDKGGTQSKGDSENTKKFRMIEALRSTGGIVTIAARRAGIGRRTHYYWLDSDPDYKRLVQDIDEDSLDLVESKLLELTQGIKCVKHSKDGETVYEVPPNTRAIIFYLLCKGKKRGYTYKDTEPVSGSGPITVIEIVESKAPISDR